LGSSIGATSGKILMVNDFMEIPHDGKIENQRNSGTKLAFLYNNILSWEIIRVL
jgi:hypothetical protein